jgi:MFS family permease
LYYNKIPRGWQCGARGASRSGCRGELWVVQLGIFLNYLGWGAVLPFEFIYLHEGRGFSLRVAGLVLGTVTGLAVVGAPAVGPVIDRIGVRWTAAGAGTALAAGYAGLAFAHTPTQAFIAAAAAGAGNGRLLPSQSALVASLVPPQLRHRATAVSRVAGNLGMGLGGALGGLVAAYGLNGFVGLFLANATTYVLYVLILAVVVRDDARPAPVAGGYGVLLRDRAFVRLALTNVAMIAVGWGIFTWIVPPYAREAVGLSPRLIGLLLLANALTVTLAQLPVAQLAEGRRRALAMAVAGLTFVVACLLVVGAELVAPVLAVAALLTAAVIVGVGECFHTTALMPLVADLAPPALRGRYMAAMGLSWWLGLALAPTLGTQLLSLSPRATMLAAGGVAIAAAVSALALERVLPPETRLTPRPAGPRRPRRRLTAWFAQPGPLASPGGAPAGSERPAPTRSR